MGRLKLASFFKLFATRRIWYGGHEVDRVEMVFKLQLIPTPLGLVLPVAKILWKGCAPLKVKIFTLLLI